MSQNDEYQEYLNLLDYNPDSKKDLTLRDEDFKKTKKAHLKDKIATKHKIECEEAFIQKVLETNPIIQRDLEINSKTLLYLLNNISDEYDSKLNQKGQEKLKKICPTKKESTNIKKVTKKSPRKINRSNQFKLCQNWQDCLIDNVKKESLVPSILVKYLKNIAYLDKDILIKLFFKNDSSIIKKLENYDILKKGLPPRNKPIKYIKIKDGNPKLINGLFLTLTPQNKYKLCSGFNIFWSILPSSIIFYKK